MILQLLIPRVAEHNMRKVRKVEKMRKVREVEKIEKMREVEKTIREIR